MAVNKRERVQVPLNLSETDHLAMLLRAAEAVSGRKPTQIVRELCDLFLPRWIEAEKTKQGVLMGAEPVVLESRVDRGRVAQLSDERSLSRATAAYDEDALTHVHERLDPRDPLSAFSVPGSRRTIRLSRGRRAG